MNNDKFDELLNWYLLNNKPNRYRLRNKNIQLPDGLSLRLVESLLPLLKRQAQERTESCSLDRSQSRNEIETVVIVSDWHIPFNDVEANEVMVKLIKKLAPTQLILNGNMNDCSSFGEFPKIREVALAFRSAKEEREVWFSTYSAIKQNLPKDCKVVYIGSQCHEGRIERWASVSPILVEDENYTIKGWLQLDRLGIDFIPEAYDPINRKDCSTRVERGTNLLVTHGTVVRSQGGTSGLMETRYNGVSTISGHTHRLAQVYSTNAVSQMVSVECGCGCLRKPWYNLKGKRRLLDWQQGLVILTINKENNTFNPTIVPVLRDSEDKPFINYNGEIIK